MPKLDVNSLTDNKSSFILFNTSCFHLFKYIKKNSLLLFSTSKIHFPEPLRALVNSFQILLNLFILSPELDKVFQ